jgi:hypothetical protein
MRGQMALRGHIAMRGFLRNEGNSVARAYCYARVSSKRGQLRCEGILLCEGFFETRATSLRGACGRGSSTIRTTQFQLRSRNYEIGITK